MGSLSKVKPHNFAFLLVLVLVLASVIVHAHPSMGSLHDELEAKAPVLFKIFIAGEGVYFGGMFLMALGMGTSLGLNPLVWAEKFRSLKAAGSSKLTYAKLFWVGLFFNAVGATTFSAIGIYVALVILPHGSWTLVPAAMIDIGFSLFARVVIYKRFGSAKRAKL